jgi:hypothetical protein
MIRKKLQALIDTLRQPSWFPGDWYAEVTSQSGHAAIIGIAMGLLAVLILPPVWTPPAVFLAYSLIWEVSVQSGQPGANWRDSLKDAVNVACGAGLVAVGALMASDFRFYWLSFAATWAAWMLGNIITTWRRLP